MKKLFLIITIIFTNNIFYGAENLPSFNVKFKAAKKYHRVISLEKLYFFIEQTVHWNKYGNLCASIESHNSKEKKELIITFFHTKDNEPITVTFWLDNNNQDPKFEEISIWGNQSYDTHQTIHALFNRARHNVPTPEKKHLNYLEETILCTRTNRIDFNPIVDLRTAQRMDSVTKKIYFSTIPQAVSIPVRRQRDEGSTDDTNNSLPIGSNSPSPENPFN